MKKPFISEYRRVVQTILEGSLSLFDVEWEEKDEKEKGSLSVNAGIGSRNLQHLKVISEGVIKTLSALKEIEEYYFTLEGIEAKFNALSIISKNSSKSIGSCKGEEDTEIQNTKAAKVLSILSTIHKEPIKSINQVKEHIEYEEQNYLAETIESLIDIKKEHLKSAYQKTFGDDEEK